MPADNVILQLQLPANVTYLSQNSTVTPSQSGQTLTWNLGTFVRGHQITFDVNGYVAASTVVGQILTAQADVTTSSPESTQANNAATNQTTVVDGHAFSANISPTSQILSIG